MANNESLVMGLLNSAKSTTAFTDKVPPSFDGQSNYQTFRKDVEFWLQLTSLDETKRGSALIARLSGEAKASATSLGTETIFSKTGVTSILEKLDKLYQLDKTDQLDIDLTTFLDYTWKSNFSVEQFIAGFHTRLDKISSLKLDEKLKGHLLLRQAGLDTHSRNMIIGAASGSYDVKEVEEVQEVVDAVADVEVHREEIIITTNLRTLHHHFTLIRLQILRQSELSSIAVRAVLQSVATL